MSIRGLLRRLRGYVLRIRQARKFIVIGPDCTIHPSVRLDVSRGGSIVIGSGAVIEQGCVLEAYGGNIRIGKGVFLGPYNVVYGHGGTNIGDHTLVAAHCVIIPANHSFERHDLIASQPLTMRGIVVGAGCWLGCGVRVLDGVNIGDGSVIGAGSVVNRDIAPFSVAAGVPCRVIKKRLA
jgi:acetyltransferase-like isoleucine patch superfamily enzyme